MSFVVDFDNAAKPFAGNFVGVILILVDHVVISIVGVEGSIFSEFVVGKCMLRLDLHSTTRNSPPLLSIK